MKLSFCLWSELLNSWQIVKFNVMYFVLKDIVEKSLNVAQNLIFNGFIFMGLRTLQPMEKNYLALSAMPYNFIAGPPDEFFLIFSLNKCKAISSQ